MKYNICNYYRYLYKIKNNTNCLINFRFATQSDYRKIRQDY